MNELTSNLSKVYGFGLLQDFADLGRVLLKNGKTLGDLISFVEKKQELLLKKQITVDSALTKKCPECGQVSTLLPVNVNSKTKTGDDSTFVFHCPRCFHEEWTNKPVRVIVHEYYEGRRPDVGKIEMAARMPRRAMTPRAGCAHPTHRTRFRSRRTMKRSAK